MTKTVSSLKKGIGSIIGGVYLVLIFITLITSFVFINSLNRSREDKYLQRIEFDNRKVKEGLEFVRVNKKADSSLNVTVKNIGGTTSEVVYIGLINETAPIQRDIYHRIDLFLNPMEIESDIATNKIVIRENDTLKLMLLTGYGNIFYYRYSENQDNGTGGSGGYGDPSILYAEDFDDLPPGFDPPEWNDLDGIWYVEDDGTGNMVYYQQDLPEEEAISISVIGNTSWVNYFYSVDVRFIQGQISRPDRGALLIFHYTGGNDYYYLFMKENLDVLELHSHGDVAHIVASTPFTMIRDTWYSVNITIVNDLVNVTINGIPCFTNVDMLLMLPGGTIGIGTSHYRVMFDNIIVKEI